MESGNVSVMTVLASRYREPTWVLFVLLLKIELSIPSIAGRLLFTCIKRDFSGSLWLTKRSRCYLKPTTYFFFDIAKPMIGCPGRSLLRLGAPGSQIGRPSRVCE
jgi:hypothetical protein